MTRGGSVLTLDQPVRGRHDDLDADDHRPRQRAARDQLRQRGILRDDRPGRVGRDLDRARSDPADLAARRDASARRPASRARRRRSASRSASTATSWPAPIPSATCGRGRRRTSRSVSFGAGELPVDLAVRRRGRCGAGSTGRPTRAAAPAAWHADDDRQPSGPDLRRLVPDRHLLRRGERHERRRQHPGLDEPDRRARGVELLPRSRVSARASSRARRRRYAWRPATTSFATSTNPLARSRVVVGRVSSRPGLPGAGDRLRRAVDVRRRRCPRAHRDDEHADRRRGGLDRPRDRRDPLPRRHRLPDPQAVRRDRQVRLRDGRHRRARPGRRRGRRGTPRRRRRRSPRRPVPISQPRDTSAPNTVGLRSKISKRKRTARFTFRGTDKGAPRRVEAALPVPPRQGPLRRRAAHRRATSGWSADATRSTCAPVDSAGNADRTPARLRFRI